MKFLKTLALAGAVTALAVTSTFAGETLDRVKERGKMVVATNSGWPPQSFLGDDNELIGFDIDVAKAVAERLGVEVSFETPDWATLTGGRWNGRFDLAVGSVTPTKARSQVVNFPAIYYYSNYVFVVHKDSDIKSREDLNGKVIGVETATTSEDYINRRLEIDAPGIPPIEYTLEPGEVRTYADSMLPFDDLRLGAGVRLDAVIAPEQTAQTAIDNGYPLRIVEGDYAFREPLVILTDKGDDEWDAKITEILNVLRDEGVLAEYTTKWYGKDYSK